MKSGPTVADEGAIAELVAAANRSAAVGEGDGIDDGVTSEAGVAVELEVGNPEANTLDVLSVLRPAEVTS